MNRRSQFQSDTSGESLPRPLTRSPPLGANALGGVPQTRKSAAALAMHLAHIQRARSKSGGAPREGVHPFTLRPGELQ